MKTIALVSIFLFVVNHSNAQFNSIKKHTPAIAVSVKTEVSTEAVIESMPSVAPPSINFKTEIPTSYKAYASLPLDDFVITSEFGLRRDPYSNDYINHQGIDLKANKSPVYSMLHGVVIKAGNDPLLGNYIKVQHGVYTCIYGHLSLILVQPLDKVVPGTPIGVSGSTGKSTGDHLHLSVKKDGRFINPSLFIRLISEINSRDDLLVSLTDH